MKSWAAGLAFPLTVFAALVALTSWLRFLADIPSPQSDGRFRHAPDYIIEGFRANQLNKSGEAEYVLAADRLQHYPDSDDTVVDNPELIYRRPDGEFIRVLARKATLNHAADVVRLSDTVRLIKPSGRTPEIRFETDAMTVLPEVGLATGAGNVVAVESNSTISGKGFSGDFNSRSFILHSDVKGEFKLEPQS